MPQIKSALSFVANADEEVGQYVQELTEGRLQAFREERAAMEAFRATLTTLADDLTKADGAKAPMIVFVDELDRCRPDFAVSLLERIKHLFAVPGVVFVLSMDRTQLSHTVRAIYGERFDADGYLRRFIDYDYKLQRPTRWEFAEFLAEKWELAKLYQGNHASRSEYQYLARDFAVLSEVFGLTLRDQEQAFQRIILAVKAAPSERHYLFSSLMVFLGVLRVGNPHLYHEYMTGTVGVDYLLKGVGKLPKGRQFLDSRRGVVVTAYLLVSAPKGAGAQELLNDAQQTAKRADATAEEKGAAADLLNMVTHASQVGGTSALKAALERLERINRQVELEFFD